AECVDGVCAPDAPACDENVARWCNADGTGYEAGGENCGSSATCDAGECKPHVCAPGALYCQTQQVRQCAENGLSSAVEQSCGGSTPLCLESDDTAFCAVCEPGQTQCSGNGVQTCDDATGEYGSVTA